MTIPSISAHVDARFVFNFRLSAEDLAARLPVDWLKPQQRGDWAVGSFCLLKMSRISPGVRPAAAGLSGLHCAFRYAVFDVRTGEPSVYVAERCTNSKLSSWITGLGFPGFHPWMNLSARRSGEAYEIEASGNDGAPVFRCHASKGPGNSALFRDPEDFGGFIGSASRSYAPSSRGNQLTVVDLRKSEGAFTELVVDQLAIDGLARWIEPDLLHFDSAYLAKDCEYSWTYAGLEETESLGGADTFTD